MRYLLPFEENLEFLNVEQSLLNNHNRFKNSWVFNSKKTLYYDYWGISSFNLAMKITRRAVLNRRHNRNRNTSKIFGVFIKALVKEIQDKQYNNDLNFKNRYVLILDNSKFQKTP